jgi:TRAP-type C4-dicarboxylate transport system permease large subunit
VAVAVPFTRDFFALAPPDLAIVLTAAGGTAVSLFALFLAGFTPGAAASLDADEAAAGR